MKKSRKLFAYLLLTVWLSSCAFAFWWFQFQYLGRFDSRLAAFNGEALSQIHLQPSTTTKTALVMHFVDPSCPCSRFSKPHIRDLEARFQGSVEFINSDSQALDLLALEVPATPAVAIWSSSGELAYFGPYSGGAVCGSGEDFVVSVLNLLQQGSNPSWVNLDAVGCFCPLNKHTKR
ncbi:DUF6436 domain-containing protein [Halioxenophilus sp. WMMB6]|uniref:DUF6436 domain-containing protein n=1 Tax=Halioxenophilus sp. WMMB6 TaxID=3073815 RepID=UPI00295E9B0B|nr:DUF6436 domain-containing protein [Halioxenophilus sp. WMMB6]